MSYRLQNGEGEYKWILDRGVPHFDAEGRFLGFYGGCAETPVDAAVSRIAELRQTLQGMREFAEKRAMVAAASIQLYAKAAETLEAKTRRLIIEHQAKQHAAEEIGKLAADMLVYDRIANGACLVGDLPRPKA
jgi:hypothetical protein